MAKSKPKILLVGSDSAYLEALQRTFAEEGRDALPVTSVAEARRVLMQEQLDASLIDFQGLDTEASELLRVVIRNHPQMLPLLLLETLSLEQALLALEAGVVRLLLRPMKLMEITKAVRDSLHDRVFRSRRRHSRIIAERQLGGDMTPADGVPTRTLVVDDGSSGHRELAAALRASDCDVIIATCGQEALHRLTEQRFDALIMPEDMGDMFAHDAVVRARNTDVEVSTIVNYADPTIDQVRTLIHLGADALLNNPLDDIEHAIGTILFHGGAARIRRQATSLDALIDLAVETVDRSPKATGAKKKKKQRFFVSDTLELPDLTAADSLPDQHQAPTMKPDKDFTTPKPSFRPLLNFGAFFTEHGTRPEINLPEEEIAEVSTDEIEIIVEPEDDTDRLDDNAEIDTAFEQLHASSDELDAMPAQGAPPLLVEIVDEDHTIPSFEITPELLDPLPVEGAAEPDNVDDAHVEIPAAKIAEAEAPDLDLVVDTTDQTTDTELSFDDVFDDIDLQTNAAAPTVEVNIDALTPVPQTVEPPRPKRNRDTLRELDPQPSFEQNGAVTPVPAAEPAQQTTQAPPGLDEQTTKERRSSHPWDQVIEKARSSTPPPWKPPAPDELARGMTTEDESVSRSDEPHAWERAIKKSSSSGDS